jgi:hypothetical protein
MPSSTIKLQPVVLGGLLIGVLSALPIVKACCCLWMICGGILTAYLMQNASVVAITVGDGALGGLMAGALGACISLVLSIPMRLMTAAPFQNEALRRFAENPDMPAWVRGMLDSSASPAAIAVRIVTGFFLMLVLGAVFSTVGGMVGAAIFAKKAPVVPPPIPPEQS